MLVCLLLSEGKQIVLNAAYFNTVGQWFSNYFMSRTP